MEKRAALLNAQAVWAWATFFGHGDIVNLTMYSHSVNLVILFPNDKFIKEREDERIRKFVSLGAVFRWEFNLEFHVDILYITWDFD